MKTTIYNDREKKPYAYFYLEAAADYCQRLKRYTNVKVHRGTSYAKGSDKKRKQSFLIKIRKGGEYLSSSEFASLIESITLSGHSEITFIFTDSDCYTDKTMGISSLDIGPSLETVILLEQIYRAFLILNNVPYHK